MFETINKSLVNFVTSSTDKKLLMVWDYAQRGLHHFGLNLIKLNK